MFGQVTGTDRDIGSNAILFYHALGDGKSDITIERAYNFINLLLRNTGSTSIGNSNITCDNQFCVNLISGDLVLIGSLVR